jgi:hypothetical protein
VCHLQQRQVLHWDWYNQWLLSRPSERRVQAKRTQRYVFTLTSEVGSVSKLALLDRTNILAFVRGAGDTPSREVHLYDDYAKEDIAKIVYKSDVTGLKITHSQ